MKPSGHFEKARLTRRQFNRTALFMTAAVLIGRASSLSAALKSRSDPAQLLKNLSAKLPFRYRAAWTRLAPRYNRMDPAEPYYRITIHHEGNKVNFHQGLAEVADDLQLDQAAHRRLGYGDIGYHFMLDYAGRVWEGRSLKYQGAHVSGQNPGNIGIVLLGNFEGQRPSAAQQANLTILVAELRSFFGISRRRVYGHRDLDSTLCPGRHLYKLIPTIKAGSESKASR